MKHLLDFKDISGGVVDVDAKNRVVTGYLSTFGNVDSHNDIVEKGAFTKSLNENRDRIFFLNQHNFNQPHGKFAVLREDAKGLYFESDPLINTTYSDDAIKLYEAGIMTEHSIGFITLNSVDEIIDSKQIRKIKEVKLYEGSNVTIGANSSAQFMGLKNMTVKDVDEKIKKIINYIRKGNISDDGFRLLELSLKELQLHSYNLGKKSLNEPKPNNTLAADKSVINTIKQFTDSIK